MKHNKDMNKNMNLHTCSVQLYITQSFCCCCCSCFCCYSVILLLQQQHYTWQMPIVLHHVSLTFAVRWTQLRCLMKKVVLCNEYHCVIIHQIDGVRICVNWSGEKIVHIAFLYIACKNMWLGSIDTNVQTVTKYSSKCI